MGRAPAQLPQGLERTLSYVVALPEVMSAAATDVASIGSVVTTASQDAAGATTQVLAAAEDEVSAVIAAAFSAHGEAFQTISAQATAFHERFVQTLSGATGAYTAAEAASIAPLAAFEQAATGVQQFPAAAATGFESWIQSWFSVADSPFLKLLADPPPPLSWIMGNQPPPLLNLLLGETVSYTTSEGMNVVTITPAHPTGENVVALHGGAFIFPPSIFHWVNYSVTAYMTGATFQVPIYPLIQEGGTAGTVVPATARFISSQIAQHGVQNVSLTGDSAGGNLALAAVQYMVQTNPLGPVPSSMVLLSPWLDVTMGQQVGMWWGDNLSVTNPMVSPLYGSLAGLPRTYVYSGGLDPLVASANALQQAAQNVGAPFSFVTAPFQSHDWVLLSPLGLLYWPQINHELGIAA